MSLDIRSCTITIMPSDMMGGKAADAEEERESLENLGIRNGLGMRGSDWYPLFWIWRGGEVRCVVRHRH